MAKQKSHTWKTCFESSPVSYNCFFINNLSGHSKQVLPYELINKQGKYVKNIYVTDSPYYCKIIYICRNISHTNEF